MSVAPTNGKSTFYGGFATASGRAVKVSDEALNLARKMLQEEPENAAPSGTCDAKPTFGGFATASGREVKVSDEALNIARKMLEEESEHAAPSGTSNALTPVGKVFGGFATASGKPTAVSESSLQKAQHLFDGLDGNLDIPATPATPTYPYLRGPAMSRIQQRPGNHRPFQPPRSAPENARGNLAAKNGSSRQLDQNQSRIQGTSVHTPLSSAHCETSPGETIGTRPDTPIKLVTPYVHKWKICGMVTAKEEIRKIKTPRGESRVFNFELTDQSGDEIRLGAWNEAADKFFPLVTKGQMYYVSNAMVKQTDKRFNTTKHDFELSLRSDSEILPCTDRQFAAPRLQFDLVKFNQLEQRVGANVDVMGVVQMVDEVTHVTSKKNNEELDKRDLHLVDETGTSIRLTLWGEQARSFTTNGQNHPVMALKGVSVREFQGVVLSTMGSTKIEMNPDCPEAHNLSGWYEEQGANIEQFSSISRDNSSSGDRLKSLRLIGIAEALQLGNRGEEKGFYFNVKAIVSIMLEKTDNAPYKACTETGCKKKLIEVDNTYRCDKCNKFSDQYKFATILSAELSDLSGTRWVTLFEESAQKLLGKTAAELGELKENDQDAYQAVFSNIQFKPFIFRIRSKAESYQDEQKIKWAVYDVHPVPWDQYQEALAKTIEILKAL